MPLPRRLLVLLSRVAYRNPPMPIETVDRVLGALELAGVRCWLWGGWGVDALAGAQQRVHRDLDLVIDERDVGTVVRALASLGYREWYRIDSDVPLHRRVVLHDHEIAGRAIDLHPMDFATHNFNFAVGTLDGRPVPCMTVELQVSTHSGYRPRRHDRADLAALRRLLTRPVSALVVPVPVAEALLEDSARDRGMPAHITLVYPFIPAAKISRKVEARLAETFRATRQFEFALRRLDEFPNVQYLVPEPADPFVELSRALLEHWPEHQPYRGAYGELIPHVTVAYGSLRPAGLESCLPIETVATEVWLMARTPGSWVPRARFELGRPHASAASIPASASIE